MEGGWKTPPPLPSATTRQKCPVLIGLRLTIKLEALKALKATDSTQIFKYYKREALSIFMNVLQEQFKTNMLVKTGVFKEHVSLGGGSFSPPGIIYFLTNLGL